MNSGLFLGILVSFGTIASSAATLQSLDCRIMNIATNVSLPLAADEDTSIAANLNGIRAEVRISNLGSSQIIASFMDNERQVLAFATLDTPTINRRSILNAVGLQLNCYSRQ